ncbi:protein adenylyltransferase SelO [Methylobacter psychrophilus]|uniref:protein adenylyltransferase SelO n=1 Tax=Methylobacter psychrophilus TaxID=96941 RepID=UPI0021D4ED88|nr:YdiU family protein [Methylobacter psychrophilus]
MTSQTIMSKLDDLIFDNRFIRELPADEETINNRRQVIGACYSRVKPTPVVNPQRVAYSREVAELLDLTTDACEADDFTQAFAGNNLIAGMDPYATCYGGHQFGNWAGQLGDGRAINLGEIVNKKGERWAIQLKGAGPTPYSRTADGLAVLRSSVREFLCSEAMYHLGVPTTRALSLMLTGENVIRDMFYDGNPKAEPGAVVCRVAPSFTRFGNFQILTARRDIALLKKLVDYTIRTDFPHLGEPSPAVYITWFTEVCRRTAEMIVHWQRVGFVHGVMNTDNMSILGLTIDYGPYGWLENYDPNWTPNTTDAEQRRYRFGNQPQIAFWNLGQLANAVYPLIEQVEPFQEAMAVYTETFEQGWQTMMAGKLGLKAFNKATDDDLCTELIVLLQLVETDMTIFYRQLAKIVINAEPLSTEFDYDAALNLLAVAYYVPEQITPEYKTRLSLWLKHYSQRVQNDCTPDAERQQQMNAVNPKYVLRNYLAQLAIDKAEQGDFVMVNELLELLRHPYDEQPDKEEFAAKRPDWARQRAGCSMLSCSS